MPHSKEATSFDDLNYFTARDEQLPIEKEDFDEIAVDANLGNNLHFN